jgi:cytidyltransferase-like protein
MIIGLVPGAMKPYHAGHHYLVEQALKECGAVVIFTTAKDRDGILGSNMQKAWRQILQPLLGVDVRFVPSPIRAIYEFLETADSKDSYRIYSGTEDMNRFASASLKKYCGNKDICNVAEDEAATYLRGVGSSPNVKGEWVRKAMIDGNFTAFRNYLPKFLKPYAKEYLSILLD